METFLCVCMSVCVLQDFEITQYLGHFKSEFDAGKSKVGLLLEKIKTNISQSVYALLLVSVPPFWYLRFRCFNSGFAIMIFDIAKVSLHTSKPKYLQPSYTIPHTQEFLVAKQLFNKKVHVFNKFFVFIKKEFQKIK